MKVKVSQQRVLHINDVNGLLNAQLAICIVSAIMGIISLKMGAMHTQKHKKAEKMIFKNFYLWPLWPYCL